MTTQVTADELRPDIVKLLGIPDGDVLMEFDTKYPECLCMVVLKDVGPQKMEQLCDLIRKRGEEKLRLCANVIESADAAQFRGLSFEAAHNLSWDFCVATVRMG